MGFFDFKQKKKSYEKLYRVKVEPVDEKEEQKINANEVIVKDKS